jgi:molecular chaperone HscB
MRVWRKLHCLVYQQQLLHSQAVALVNSSQNFFTLFEMPLSSEVDTVLLEQKYKQLQAQLHPDRHVDKQGGSKLAAIQQASLLNDAYATLKAPLRRAEHLLYLKGIDTSSYAQADLDKDFLLSQLKLREKLEDLQIRKNPEALEAMHRQMEHELASKWSKFSARFDGGDFQAAYQTFRELQFLHKLIEEIRETEDRLLDF